MNPSKFIQVGYILKPHGLKGGLKLKLQFPLRNNTSLVNLFFGNSPNPLPFFIKSISTNNPFSAIVELEDINSREDALKYFGQEIYVTEEQFIDHFESGDDKQETVKKIVGFKLLDAMNKQVGTIEDVIDLPHQTIAQLFIKQQEVLIPISEDNIIEIDDTQHTIKVDIPEGLLEIYLES